MSKGPGDLATKVASMLSRASKCAVLTGAGISVDSGIHAFRGYQGLWEKYDPVEFAHIMAFKNNPEKVWSMLGKMIPLLLDAEPNAAHFAIAELERMGIVKSVITQNIDGLHQRAGNSSVIEFHGNAWTLICTDCAVLYDTAEKVKSGIPPVCSCGAILKPHVVFFGEPIPQEVARLAFETAIEADLFMVIGTSGTVAPANELPLLALNNKTPVIIINPEKSDLSDHPGTLWLEETAGGALKRIIERIKDASPVD